MPPRVPAGGLSSWDTARVHMSRPMWFAVIVRLASRNQIHFQPMSPTGSPPSSSWVTRRTSAVRHPTGGHRSRTGCSLDLTPQPDVQQSRTRWCHTAIRGTYSAIEGMIRESIGGIYNSMELRRWPLLLTKLTVVRRQNGIEYRRRRRNGQCSIVVASYAVMAYCTGNILQ